MMEYFKISTGKPTGKRTLGGPRRTWEDNVTIDHKEINVNRKSFEIWRWRRMEEIKGHKK
jgi:hypothetical protein